MIASPTDPATARCWAASRGLACAFPALGASLWSERRGRGEGSSGDELGAAARGPPETWRKARGAPHPLRPRRTSTARALLRWGPRRTCTRARTRVRAVARLEPRARARRQPARAHTLTRGHRETRGRAPGVPPSRAAAGARPLYSLQEAENFLSATTTSASTTQVASRAAMTMAAMAPGPSEPAEDGGPRQPRARPPHPFLPPPPPPPGPPRPRGRTAALVQTLPRRAVLGAGRGGGRRRSGGRGLPRRAGALRRVFSRRQFGRLVPQGGLGLLRAFGCKAKDRCGAQEAGTAPPLLADRAGALCAGLRAVLALRFRGGGERGGQRRPRGRVWPQSPYRGQADPRTASPLRLRGQIDGVLRDPQALS